MIIINYQLWINNPIRAKMIADQWNNTTIECFTLCFREQAPGTMGKYQIIAVTIMCVLGYLTGGLMLITPYIFYQDPYQCPDSIPGSNCFDYVCSLPLDVRAAFIPANPTIDSLANKFGDFRCDD